MIPRIATLGALALLLMARAHAADGLTDITFEASRFSEHRIAAVAVASKGIVFTAGAPQQVNGLPRPGLNAFTRTGLLQPFTPELVGASERFFDVEIDSKNRIITTSDSINLVSRFLPSGRRDSRFKRGLTLRSQSDPDAEKVTIAKIVVAADGRMVIAGDFIALGDNAVVYYGFVRLLPDGSMDPTFVSIMKEGSVFTDVAVDGNCVAFLTGDAQLETISGQTTVTGVLACDGSSVRVLMLTGSTPQCVAMQSDGKVLVGDNGQVLRLIPYSTDPSGYSDPTWSSPYISGLVRTIMQQGDGRILVGGDFVALGDSPFPHRGIARLNPDGTPEVPDTFIDENFTGFCDLDESGAGQGVLDIDLQGDGAILAVGDFTGANSFPRECLARLLNDKCARWVKGAPRNGPGFCAPGAHHHCLQFVSGWYYCTFTAFVPGRPHVTVGFSYLEAAQDGARVTELRIPTAEQFSDPVPPHIGTGYTYLPSPSLLARDVGLVQDDDVSTAPCLAWAPGTQFRVIDCQDVGVIAFKAEGQLAVVTNNVQDDDLTPLGPAVRLLPKTYRGIPQSRRGINNVGQMYSGDASFANELLRGIPRVLQYVSVSTGGIQYAISYYLVETPEEDGVKLTLNDATSTDHTRPSASIRTAGAALSVNSSFFLLWGKAADRAWLRRVRYRVNGGAWQDSAGRKYWSLIGQGLVLGKNVVEIAAEDSNGNSSRIARRIVTRR